MAATVRRGRRARGHGVVVHVLGRRDGPTRVAFAVPRAVGPAVVRNRARRRAQEVLREWQRDGLVRDGQDLVLRLTPPAGGMSSGRLADSLHTALGRAGALAPGSAEGRR